MKTYLFFRGEWFYPVELKDDKDAIANAAINKGTTKIVDPIDDRIVWEETKEIN